MGPKTGAEATVLEAGATTLVVTYPDELLEEALDWMIRHDVGRLRVVRRDDPQKLEGYLGRTGVAAAWRMLQQEETVRETGWLSARLRLLRRKVVRVLRSPGGRVNLEPEEVACRSY